MSLSEQAKFKKLLVHSRALTKLSENLLINFSLYLIAFPIDIIDYVIVHELAHLIEFNHSKKFWAVVSKIDPSYKEKVYYLKKNSNLVTL